MKLSKTFWLAFWLLAGLLVGSLIASVCAGIPYLSWLAYTESISLSPAADLIILDFNLNLVFRLNLAQVAGILLGVLCWRHF